MNSRLELGRIAGIPIVLDMFFLLVMFFFTQRYFLSGDLQQMSAGLIIVAGLFLSVLLHELGHAFAGRMCGVGIGHIELNGLGGLCHFETSLPRSVLKRTFIFLAGPAANLALWWLFGWLADFDALDDKPVLLRTLTLLAWANLSLLIFNLLPAFPLDGGRTLEAWLSAIFGNPWAVRIVGCLGLAVAAFIGWRAVQPSLSIFMLMMAVLIAIANFAALQSVGFGRRR